MGYKTVLTVLTDPADAAPMLAAALPFVRAQGAHLDVLCLGIDRTQTGYYMAGATALVHDQTLAQARTEATRIEEAARAALAREDLSWAVEALVAQTVTTTALVARRARFADLVIVPKPYGAGRAPDDPLIVEAALFQGQAPALVLDAASAPLPQAPGHVVIAWNEAAEALNAVRAALPLLVAARSVDIVVVDPQRHAAELADPGQDLCRMLVRHGAKADVTILAQTLPRVSDVIDRHVQDRGADLLVMGAYGHSRFREAILGGATRNMLEHARVPVFMAH